LLSHYKHNIDAYIWKTKYNEFCYKKFLFPLDVSKLGFFKLKLVYILYYNILWNNNCVKNKKQAMK